MIKTPFDDQSKGVFLSLVCDSEIRSDRVVEIFDVNPRNLTMACCRRRFCNLTTEEMIFFGVRPKEISISISHENPPGTLAGPTGENSLRNILRNSLMEEEVLLRTSAKRTEAGYADLHSSHDGGEGRMDETPPWGTTTVAQWCPDGGKYRWQRRYPNRDDGGPRRYSGLIR